MTPDVAQEETAALKIAFLIECMHCAERNKVTIRSDDDIVGNITFYLYCDNCNTFVVVGHVYNENAEY